MPWNNRFQHQPYPSGPPTSRVHYLCPAPPSPENLRANEVRIPSVGAALRAERVAAIYLVHGTFLGEDALGMLTDLARFAPDAARAVRRWQKQIIDAVAGDVGNFTAGYAADFERLLRGHGETSIPVRLFHWSGENHHLGRADGAVRLIDELLSRRFAPGSRILLWGHSHSGNLFALMTNLLGSEPAVCRDFFDRARSFYECRLFPRFSLPEWQRVEQAVCGGGQVLEQVELDLVTFGTPVRYGWETSAFRSLTHFIHHRPAPGDPPYRAKFPPTTSEVLYALRGDLVQQIGVAGTNFAPPFWELRAWRADIRLGRLLQAGCPSADLLARWRLGVRVHQDGENLLVDYGPGTANVAQHLFGHAVYTRREWLPFHAQEVARRVYGLAPPPLPAGTPLPGRGEC